MRLVLVGLGVDFPVEVIAAEKGDSLHPIFTVIGCFDNAVSNARRTPLWGASVKRS
jgi:hypothetical protein